MMKKRRKRFVFVWMMIIMLATGIFSPAFTYEAQASVFSEEDRKFLLEAQEALQEILSEKEVMALVYLTDYYSLREAPSDTASEVVLLAGGQQVQIQQVTMTEEMENWVFVTCTVKGQAYTGYVKRQNLACSDELFLEWENLYGMNPALYQTQLMAEESLDENGEIVYADIELFPESYQEALYELKKQYPNWTFVKMNTGLDWNTVVTEQLKGGRSLVHGSKPTAMKEGKYGQNWYYASKEALEYYLDPRNGLTEEGIFQFEQLTYNASYHTEGAVQTFLDKTFMKGLIPDTTMTYAYGITAIGKQFNISPFHLASRIYQEQGDGTSALISGTYPGYEGYYNYYNIGATGSTDKEVIENGLAYAKKRDWNSHYYSLHFGAEVIGANYIAKGQDTLYLQKFDVDNSDGELYWHQYMQNISAPSSEGANVKNLYKNSNALNNTFVFKIPVFENMPESSCAKPTVNTKVVLEILDGYKDPKIYMDGIPVEAVSRNGYYIATAPTDTVSTAVMYQYNENNVPMGMTVWELQYDGSGYLAKELAGLRDLLSFHGFSVRITGRSGIRYKSGIAQETKGLLTENGVDGYVLKEYGTLLLPKKMLGDDLLTLDTEKAASGLSYGVDENGQPVDKVLEKVDGRDRFASVLVGLPVSEYQTEFAFRAYMILEKDDKEIVVYGSQNSKSIYGLAKQVLAAGIYTEGSSPDLFLKQLISDADAYTASLAMEQERDQETSKSGSSSESE